MPLAPSLPRLHSPFLCCPLKSSSFTASPSLSTFKSSRNQGSPASYPCVRAIDLDQNSVSSPPRFLVCIHRFCVALSKSLLSLPLLLYPPSSLQEIRGHRHLIYASELLISTKTRFLPHLFYSIYLSSYVRLLFKGANLDMYRNPVVAISVGLVSVAVGIGIPVFYETQIDNAAKRENTQPCFPCNSSGAQKCRFCLGTGSVAVVLAGDEKEVSSCVSCEGVGSLTCTTCQGTGIQPRYLDRREFKDDD